MVRILDFLDGEVLGLLPCKLFVHLELEGRAGGLDQLLLCLLKLGGHPYNVMSADETSSKEMVIFSMLLPGDVRHCSCSDGLLVLPGIPSSSGHLASHRKIFRLWKELGLSKLSRQCIKITLTIDTLSVFGDLVVLFLGVDEVGGKIWIEEHIRFSLCQQLFLGLGKVLEPEHVVIVNLLIPLQLRGIPSSSFRTC